MILVFIASSVVAQEKDSTTAQSEYKTIFGKSGEKTKVSGFGTVTYDFMNINNDFGLMIGGDGAVLINRSFYIGFYGKGLTTTPKFNYNYYKKDSLANISANKRLAFGHGGLFIGYIFQPEKAIHFGFNLKFGGGVVSIIDDYTKDYYYNEKDYYKETPIYPVYVLTPQVDLEMNITYWFKFKISAGYQFVTKDIIKYKALENGSIVEKELFNTSDLSSPLISLGFVFGWFK